MKKLFTLLLLTFSIFITTHAQQSGRWIPQGENLLSADYTTYDISAVNEQVVWALMCKTAASGDPDSCKVIRSIDGGVNWATIDLNNLAISYAVGIFALNDTMAWITAGNKTPSQRKIFRTKDGGNSWQEQYAVATSPSSIWAPAVKFENEQKGFFIDVWGRKSGRTINGGENWTTSDLFPTGSATWYWGQLAQENWWDIKGDTLWWGTSQFISRSIDGGSNWNRINTNLPEKNTIQSIKFNKSGLGLAISDVVTTISGIPAIEETVILRSENFGETWNRLPNVPFPMSILTYIPGTENSFIGVSGQWFAYGEQIGKYTSAFTADGGNTWTLIDQGIARNAIDFVSPTVGWAGRVENFNYGSSNPVIFKWEGSLSTSAKDIIKDDFIRVNPNPFTTHALLEFELKDNTLPIEITVTDILGKTIKSFNLDKPNAGINQIPLTLDAPAGVFLLLLRQGNHVQTLKMIKH
jgi:photosystem II stability/assembly factor-like uncharacterized protein